MIQAASVLIYLYMLAPIAVVVVTAFGSSAYPVFPPVGFTLHWFVKAWQSDDLRNGAFISLKVGLSCALVATVLGTASALGLSRYRLAGGKYLSTLMMTPILFPGVVLGLALLVTFFKVGLAQTFVGLVAGHVVVTTPFVIRLVGASLAEYDTRYEEASRNLGAGWWRTLLQVTLPLLRPGITAGALFAFIISFDELVITIFLAGPSLQTLPIRVFTRIEYSSDPTVSAVATCILVAWMLLGIPLYTRLTTAGGRR